MKLNKSIKPVLLCALAAASISAVSVQAQPKPPKITGTITSVNDGKIVEGMAQRPVTFIVNGDGACANIGVANGTSTKVSIVPQTSGFPYTVIYTYDKPGVYEFKVTPASASCAGSAAVKVKIG